MTQGKAPLDRLDLKILAALRRNGRITKVELSQEVGLSATPCYMRIAKLEALGYIRGYHADLDIERLGGLSRFTVTVSIREYTPEKARQFESLIAGVPYIVECDAVFGSIDYIMTVYAESTQHYHEIMEPLLCMEIDYTTYPVSRPIRDRNSVSLNKLVRGPANGR